MLRYFSFFALVLSVNGASAPFITPCKRGDAACVVSSARAAFPTLVGGVPALGVPSLDPMRLPRVHSEDKGLKLTFTDSVLRGVEGCSVEGVKFDMDKMKQSVALKCSLSLRGNYKLSGQLLILPVQGNGKYKINIKDIVLKVSGDVTTKPGKDGKEHWHIGKWRHSFAVKTNVHFDFENLFNGNKALADPVLEFANSNWSEVMQEVAPPVVRAIVSEAIDALNALYAAVPAEELYVAS